jgi:hypothetical protein
MRGKTTGLRVPLELSEFPLRNVGFRPLSLPASARIVAYSTVRPLAALGVEIVCFSALNLEEIYLKGASPRIRPSPLITLYRRNSSPVGVAGTWKSSLGWEGTMSMFRRSTQG